MVVATLTNFFFRITYALFPVILFLSLRPSPLPNVAYIEALQLHKWVSRLVVLLGLIHSCMYLGVFIVTKRPAKIVKFDNLLGVVALVLLLVMAVASLKPIRRRFYSVFYYLHYPLAWVTTVLIIFHARPGVLPLAFWCVAILAGQVVHRVFTAARAEAVAVSQIAPTLKLVVLPRHVLPAYFPVGTHVRVSQPLRTLAAWTHATHPYTVASLPEDGEVRLLVRELKFKIGAGDELAVLGPFPSAAAASEIYARARRVLVFAGGSGLSYGAAVCRGLELRGVDVQLVWMVRSRAEITALGLLEVANAEVYVTGGGNTRYLNKQPSGDATGVDDALELEELLDEEEDVEDYFEEDTVVPATPTTPTSGEFVIGDDDKEDLSDGEAPGSSSRHTLVSENSSSTLASKGPPVAHGLGGVRIHRGRPDFRLIADEYFRGAADNEDGSWVVACGPEGLVNQAQKWAKQYSSVEFFGEKYVL